jgi:TPP-dependent indolepyruvate ferredoxin oxidoreductase alpha subunit
MYMPVRPALEKKKEEEVDVDALIAKGAKVKEDFKKETKKWPIINVRISAEMLQEVDEAVEARVGITRTGWILEAIHEKLKKEL